LADQADVLLVAGDWTTCGDPDEAAIGASEVSGLGVPVFTVLGNHDFHLGRESEVRTNLERAGIRVLEGESEVIPLDGVRLGVAGLKGFGGGFAGACATDFGEAEMKAFVRHTRTLAERLEDELGGLEADAKVALLHYSPVEMTLVGERPEIYPFLGSYLLGEAVDRAGADLVLHGHAHRGREKGLTAGGIHVRNVAQPVIQHAYNLYHLDGPE
jgi:Icc-related predicted phosphoesterase